MNRTLLLLASLVAESAYSAVLLVGPNMPYELPSEAAMVAEDGDIVEIEATVYAGDAAVWTQNDLVIRGVGGRPHIRADGAAAEGKAIWVIKGDNTVIENIEMSGATVADANGAGIRLEGTNLTVRGCYFHDNENGILTGPNPDSEVLIEYSEFANNGYGDGYSHNMYIGRVAKFTLQFSYVHHARIGHQVKSRAVKNEIRFNRLMDERSGTSSYIIDLPDPGEAFVVGNEMQQGPDADNWAMVHSAQDLQLVNNTLVNDRSSGVFVTLSGPSRSSVLQNNLFIGTGRFEAEGAEMRGNLVIDDGKLADRRGFDYRLTAASPAIDTGTPVDPTAQLLWEYEHVASRKEREDGGQVDVGAHSY
ncbi:MAG TPA: right-handed parallel beta-helix repeat-containing protein [Woeseiaceae bacterium]|nr:right-handed parallel beta-helix repeat-containing protein [Woeseiaceae bacterium]